MIKRIIPIVLLFLTSMDTNAQMVNCGFTHTTRFCNDFAGLDGCIVDYHYACTDGVERTTSDAFSFDGMAKLTGEGLQKSFSCRGLEYLYAKKPDCEKEYELERKRVAERKRKEAEIARLKKMEQETIEKSNQASEKASKEIIEANSDYFVDKRDGEKYRIITIGNQTWMAENLRYDAENSTATKCSENDCEKYGRLYLGKESRKACPTGWRLPYDEEIKTLFAVTKKSQSTLLVKKWGDVNRIWGTDEYGFSILPHPEIIPEPTKFKGGPVSFFWKSSPRGTWTVNSLGDLDHYSKTDLNGRASIRCIKDETEISIETGVMVDPRDKKEYKTAKIGKQEWMAENLNYSKKGKCYEDLTENCNNYGRIYTWNEAKNVCPAGWHLPDVREWENLLVVAGGRENGGKKLKSTNGWEKNEEFASNGNNSLNFTATPGYYDYQGQSVASNGSSAVFWTSSAVSLKHSNVVVIHGKTDYIPIVDDKIESRFSVRCISDKIPVYKKSENKSENEQNCKEVVADAKKIAEKCETLSKGSSERTLCVKQYKTKKKEAEKACVITTPNNKGFVTDERDGKKYETVVIGGLVWMAENLNYADSLQTPILVGNSWNSFYDEGMYYTQRAAMEACPNGWHLPDNEEWENLFSALDEKKLDASALVEKDFRDNWPNATNELGFSAFPFGCIGGDFSYKNSTSDGDISFWSANTKKGSDETDVFYLSILKARSNEAKIEEIGGIDAFFNDVDRLGLPVRCVKDGGATNSTQVFAFAKAKQVCLRTDANKPRQTSDIMSVINALMPSVKSLYDEHQKTYHANNDCEFGGKVTMELKITPSGNVSKATIKSSTTGYEEFDSALKKSIEITWNFCAASEENTVTVPLTLEPENPSSKCQVGWLAKKAQPDIIKKDNASDLPQKSSNDEIAQRKERLKNRGQENLDDEQAKASAAAESAKQNDSDNSMSTTKLLRIGVFSAIAIGGAAAAYMFDKKAKDATATPPTNEAEFKKGHDDAKQNQNVRNISLGVAAAGLVALGLTFLF
jgi:uncharacterized protein (TIGR02145 family)